MNPLSTVQRMQTVNPAAVAFASGISHVKEKMMKWTIRFGRLWLALMLIGTAGWVHAETPEEAETIGRKLGSIDKASTFLKLLNKNSGL